MPEKLLHPNSPDANLEFSKLPGYGTAYLDHLIGEFEAIKTKSVDADAAEAAQAIISASKNGTRLTWGSLYTLERALLRMQPVEDLRQRAWTLEARYRDVVGDSKAYDAYLQSDSGQIANENEAHLRARMDNLVRELYRLYTVTACRENLRNRLSRLASIFCVILGLVLIVLALVAPGGMWTVGMAAAAGGLGGFISFQRRVQSVPNRGESLADLVELSTGSGMYLSPVSGAVFAIILYLIFASGLAAGDLFPKISTIAQPNPSGVPFRDFAWGTGASTGVDWGKLLVWSFIAGFAERFVPDTLTRLIARVDDKKA